MDSYDVIIVGAGPGGLKCAEILGSSPLSVLVLEKNNEIGPKVCAGGLTGKGFELLNLPTRLIEYRYNRARLQVNNLTTTLKSETDFVFTIDREEFGQWQLQKVKTFANIEVRTNSKVTQITQEFIVANGEKIAYKYLVGADGSNSIVKTFLGIKSKKTIVGIQYIIPTDKYKDFEIYFKPKYFSAWYAWIFPHRGYVSIGCGCNPKLLSGDRLRENFHRWLKARNIDISKGKYESFPMNCDYKGIQFGQVFLVGDAAGLVSTFTGEGIYQALISGEEVANIILNPDYVPVKMTDIIYKQKRHEKLIDMLVKFGWFMPLIFTAGLMLFKIPKYEKKAIRFFG